ncbi:MAG TPA: GNAT family N-acetyltransferase [Casimicrobiaceae bacterium]|jgi:RimJ/RimL family protein N-acetyltransferase
MKPPWMQTLRLDLREFTRDDFGDLLRLDSDPRVMKYINGGKPSSRNEVKAALKRVAGYYRKWYGLGVWYATRRDTGAFIGWYCLKYCPPTSDVEVGYRLLHEAWGQGFATEGATELVHYGFDDLGLNKIIGVTHPGNRASQRVLMKAGLADAGYGRYYGRRLRLFIGHRDARQANAA